MLDIPRSDLFAFGYGTLRDESRLKLNFVVQKDSRRLAWLELDQHFADVFPAQ